MNLFRSLFLITTCIAILTGVVYTLHKNNYIPQDTLNGVPFQVAEWTSNQIDPLLIQAQPTISHVQSINEDAGAVLGDFIQVNEKSEDKKLHERTLEVAQYTYCKQIVEEWEKNMSDSSSDNASEK